VLDHTYDAIAVDAGDTGLRAAFGLAEMRSKPTCVSPLVQGSLAVLELDGEIYLHVDKARRAARPIAYGAGYPSYEHG